MRTICETIQRQKKYLEKCTLLQAFFVQRRAHFFQFFFFGLQVCRKSRRRQLTIDAITVLAAKWLGRHGFGAKQAAPVETCAKQGGARSGSGKEPRRMVPCFPCASCFAKDYVLGKVKMREREQARARARARAG
jgi:hypothetical protein